MLVRSMPSMPLRVPEMLMVRSSSARRCRPGGCCQGVRRCCEGEDASDLAAVVQAAVVARGRPTAPPHQTSVRDAVCSSCHSPTARRCSAQPGAPAGTGASARRWQRLRCRSGCLPNDVLPLHPPHRQLDHHFASLRRQAVRRGAADAGCAPAGRPPHSRDTPISPTLLWASTTTSLSVSVNWSSISPTAFGSRASCSMVKSGMTRHSRPSAIGMRW